MLLRTENNAFVCSCTCYILSTKILILLSKVRPILSNLVYRGSSDVRWSNVRTNFSLLPLLYVIIARVSGAVTPCRTQEPQKGAAERCYLSKDQNFGEGAMSIYNLTNTSIYSTIKMINLFDL